MVEALVEEAKKIIEEGVEARLAARDQSARRSGRDRRRCWTTGAMPTTRKSKSTRFVARSSTNALSRLIRLIKESRGFTECSDPQSQDFPAGIKTSSQSRDGDNGPVRGTMVIRPTDTPSGAHAGEMDARIKKTVRRTLLPLFIPRVTSPERPSTSRL